MSRRSSAFRSPCLRSGHRVDLSAKEEKRIRISQQSVWMVGWRLSLLKNYFSRARRNGFHVLFNARLLRWAATSLMILVVCFYLTKSSNHSGNDAHLRSSQTAPTRAPPPDSVAVKPSQFNPGDFRRKHLSPPQGTSAIIFYNLFIPDESEAVEHVIAVVTEQLGQVAKSLRALDYDKRGTALFYNLIGNSRAFPEKRMKKMCNALKPKLYCKQIGYYEIASESVTLQDLYDYCQNDDVADARVTYLHAKGSYHQTLVNTNWRRSLTDAVVHPDCLFPPDDRCNVCGAQFYTRFATMYPGNMWTAKCSYVKKLLPPLDGREYDKLKEKSIINFLKYRLWGQLRTTLMEDRVDYFGLGRYRLEHWIGSHPSIQPCEVHNVKVDLGSMITGRVTPDDYDWGIGPRRENVTDEIHEARRRLDGDKDAQFLEYYYLPGNLIKWFTLYGSGGVPADNSWQWKFFPGGDRWKKLVTVYNVRAVEEMVMQSSHAFHSAFDSKGFKPHKFEADDEIEKLFSETTPPLVVFYHISFPEDKKMDALHALRSQLDVLALGQYDIISRSYRRQRPVILYFSGAGDSSKIGFFTKTVCESKRNVTCRNLGGYESTKANGETLHHLHNFCLAKPSMSVTYLSNQLPGLHGDNRTELHSMQKIRAYTTAVTSNMCLKSRQTCNVCGAEFYPLPFNHFVGNMFTATCNYVKDLLPPKHFEGAMNDAADDTLVSQLRGALTTDLFQFTPQNLGLDQYSVEHWIGSHPDFKPCDVAPVRHSWFPLFTGGSYLPNDYSSSRTYDFKWSEAPRRSSAPPGRLSRKIEKMTIEKDDVAFREYFYLAGNLYRWYRLYNGVPPLDSWAWKWYPRGDQWMQGAKKYGSNVVTKLSKPFWDEGVPF